MSSYARVAESESAAEAADGRPGAPGSAAAAISATTSVRSLFSSLVASFTGGVPSVPPSEAARVFSSTLRAWHGDAHVPAFFAGSYHEALDEGRRKRKAVLLYLHSRLHADGKALSGAVCAPAVRAACEETGAIAWAGDVAHADSWDAATRMDAAAFPFVGIYAYVGGNESGSGGAASSGTYKRLWVREGAGVAADALAAALRNAAERAAQPQVEARRGRGPAAPPQSADQRLRQQQDRCVVARPRWPACLQAPALRLQASGGDESRKQAPHAPSPTQRRTLTPLSARRRLASRSEYLDALAADERAAAAEAAAAAAAAEAARAAAAAAAAAEDASELEAAVRMSIELDREGEVSAARARLAASPEPSGAGAAAVRVALPSGARVERRFAADAPLSLVADFALVASADLQAPLPPRGFDLRSAMPRATYDCHSAASPDAQRTLAALGLTKASLMVSLI
jgi:hypothetical protein